MNIIYTFHFLNGISEINQLFDDILIIWPAPLYATHIATAHFSWWLKKVTIVTKRGPERVNMQGSNILGNSLWYKNDTKTWVTKIFYSVSMLVF